MSELAQFAGRFHPVLVHLPIGFLILAAVLELLARRPAFAGARPVMGPVLAVSAVSALTAAAAGLLLGSSGDYAGFTYASHKWLGIAVATSATATAAAWYAQDGAARAPTSVWYRTSLGASVLLLFVAGHFGAALTHGEGYLTDHLPWRWRGRAPAEAPVRPAREVVVYTEVVAPVLRARCAACHGSDENEGGLRLDSPEGIRKGGDSGAVVVASEANRSELMRRVSLPSGHADAMPPAGRSPLSVAEATLLRWWIDAGATFDGTIADLDPPPQVFEILETRLGPLERGGPAILAVAAPAAGPDTLARVEALGVGVTPLADGTGWLSVHCTNVGRSFGDEDLDVVAALAPSVTWLDLSGTGVTDAGLGHLTRFTALTRLRLDRTGITDAGLRHLAGLDRLEYLNLHSTGVTDAGLDRLQSLPALRSLYLWQTAVTARGAEQLKTANPRLTVDLGHAGDAATAPAS